MPKRKAKDAIKDYLEGKLHFADLTRLEREHFKLVKLIESMWLDGKSDASIRSACLENWPLTSRRSIGRAMNDAREVFGDMRVVNKNLQRYRAEQMALKAYEIAEGKDNERGMVAAVKAYIEATGMNVLDPDMPELEKLQPSLNVMVVPPGMEEIIKQQMAGGVINDTELPPGFDPGFIEDVEYETLESSIGGTVPGGADSTAQ
ncbi:MAG: hypothetical protein AAF828_01525 [Bacteroidota bacterium]